MQNLINKDEDNFYYLVVDNLGVANKDNIELLTYLSSDECKFSYDKELIKKDLEKINNNKVKSIKDIEYVHNILSYPYHERTKISKLNIRRFLSKDNKNIEDEKVGKKLNNLLFFIKNNLISFIDQGSIIVSIPKEVIHKLIKDGKLNFDKFIDCINREGKTNFHGLFNPYHEYSTCVQIFYFNKKEEAIKHCINLRDIRIKYQLNMVNNSYSEILSQLESDFYMSKKDFRSFDFKKLFYIDDRIRSILNLRLIKSMSDTVNYLKFNENKNNPEIYKVEKNNNYKNIDDYIQDALFQKFKKII